MPETVIAFDFGLRRIGVAVGQEITRTARPLGVVRNGPDGPDWPRIEKLVREWEPARIIVGLPLTADGYSSDITRASDAFAVELGRYGIAVSKVDERYTSIDAQELLKEKRASGLSGRISKEMIDSAAAALIAERWLKKTGQSE